jgi:hypothetical protein
MLTSAGYFRFLSKLGGNRIFAAMCQAISAFWIFTLSMISVL